MVVSPCECHTLNYGNDTGGRPEWPQKHAWLQKAYLIPIFWNPIPLPIAYQRHAKRLPKIQTSLPIQFCMGLAPQILQQYLTLVSPSRQTPLNFSIHLDSAELYPNSKAQSRCYHLVQWDTVHSPGHYPGQLAPGCPAWSGGLDRVTSRDSCWPQLLCDYVALWCAMYQWCKTPPRLPTLSPALKGSRVGRSAGSLWRCV